MWRGVEPARRCQTPRLSFWVNKAHNSGGKMSGMKLLPLARGANGWVFGNLFEGWIVGFVVDFATSSAYTLEPALVSVSLTRATDTLYAVVRFYTDRNGLITERRMKLIPED
jgi:hypothetical protein